MFVHSVTIVTNDWPGVKCQPAPSPPCFLPLPRYAYTAQVCADRVCVLSMNRPADKGNDYTGVFILNLIFIDESYQLGRPVWSCLQGGGMSAIFHSCFNISSNDSSTQFVSLSSSTRFLSKHTCLLISSDHFIQPAPSFTFSGAFFIISAFCHRYLRGNWGFASERASAEHGTYYGSQAATEGILVMFYPRNEFHSLGSPLQS